MEMTVDTQKVLRYGGYQHVIANKLWPTAARVLKLPKSCTSQSFQLRNNYEKYLLVGITINIVNIAVKVFFIETRNGIRQNVTKLNSRTRAC